MNANKPDFVIEEAPDVAFGKAKQPNPYAAHIAALIEHGPKDGEVKGKAVTFTPYKVEGREMDPKQLFEYVVRKIRPEVPSKYTVRTLLLEDGRIKLWLTPKIERTPKAVPPVEGVAEGAVEVPAETPVETDAKATA